MVDCCGNPLAMAERDIEWPRLTSDSDVTDHVREAKQFHQLLSGAEEAARGDLWSIVEQLAHHVADLQETVAHSRGDAHVPPASSTPSAEATSAALDMERDVRWLDARVVLLEQALTDSRSEVENLRAYIEAYAQELRIDIDAVIAQTNVVRERLDADLSDLNKTTLELEQLVFDLQVDKTLSKERVDIAVSDLFEAIDKNRHMAADAQLVAEATSEHSQNLAEETHEAKEATEEVRVIAEKAQYVAERSSDEVAALQAEAEEQAEKVRKATEEVRSIAEGAETVAVRSSEEVTALQAETKAEAEKAREVAEQARQIAKGAETAAAASSGFDPEELRSLAVEVEALQSAIDQASLEVGSKVDEAASRLRAEADSSSDKLHADLEAEVTALRTELTESQNVDHGETVKDDQTLAQQREMAELQRQIRDMQSQIVSMSKRSATGSAAVPEGEAPTKRWVAHLDRSAPPTFITPELTAAEEDGSNG